MAQPPQPSGPTVGLAMTQATSPNFADSSTLLSISLLSWGLFYLWHWGVFQHRGCLLCMYLHFCLNLEGPFTSPILAVFLVLTMLEFERESANQKPEQSHKSHVTSVVNVNSCDVFFSRTYICLPVLQKKVMLDEWNIYRRILDRRMRSLRGPWKKR